jgi:hypothetical protein
VFYVGANTIEDSHHLTSNGYYRDHLGHQVSPDSRRTTVRGRQPSYHGRQVEPDGHDLSPHGHLAKGNGQHLGLLDYHLIHHGHDPTLMAVHFNAMAVDPKDLATHMAQIAKRAAEIAEILPSWPTHRDTSP